MLFASFRRGLETSYSRTLSPGDGSDYDAFVDAAAGGSYAQARSWAPAAIAGRSFSPRWILVRREGRVIGSALVLRSRAGISPLSLSLPFAVIERGPVVGALSDLPDVLSAVRQATLGRGIARLSVMPYFAGEDIATANRALATHGFRSVQSFDGAHARTVRVDLRGKTEASIFAGKSGESLRRKLRQAEKAGAIARRGNRTDLAALERLHRELMQGQARGAKPKAYYDALGEIVDEGSRGAIFLGEHEGETVSALFASRHGRIATFVIGATTSAERSFSKMVLPMAAAVRWALDVGCETFDMGGIPLEGDPDAKRLSIAQFKFDFAKEPVALVGEHARWL